MLNYITVWTTLMALMAILSDDLLVVSPKQSGGTYLVPEVGQSHRFVSKSQVFAHKFRVPSQGRQVLGQVFEFWVLKKSLALF